MVKYYRSDKVLFRSVQIVARISLGIKITKYVRTCAGMVYNQIYTGPYLGQSRKYSRAKI